MIYYLVFFLFILCLYLTNSVRENFEWSPIIENKFNEYTKTNLPFYQFNIPVVKQQATEGDVLYLLKNSHWYWDSDTIKQYKDQINNNPILSVDLDSSVNKSRQVYNNNAMKELLFWNTPEGKFLVYGAKKHPYYFKCHDNSVVKYKYGETHESIKDEDIPNEIPGFSFLSTPCNPCSKLDNPLSEDSCPFRIKFN